MKLDYEPLVTKIEEFRNGAHDCRKKSFEELQGYRVVKAQKVVEAKTVYDQSRVVESSVLEKLTKSCNNSEDKEKKAQSVIEDQCQRCQELEGKEKEEQSVLEDLKQRCHDLEEKEKKDQSEMEWLSKHCLALEKDLEEMEREDESVIEELKKRCHYLAEKEMKDNHIKEVLSKHCLALDQNLEEVESDDQSVIKELNCHYLAEKEIKDQYVEEDLRKRCHDLNKLTKDEYVVELKNRCDDLKKKERKYQSAMKAFIQLSDMWEKIVVDDGPVLKNLLERCHDLEGKDEDTTRNKDNLKMELDIVKQLKRRLAEIPGSETQDQTWVKVPVSTWLEIRDLTEEEQSFNEELLQNLDEHTLESKVKQPEEVIDEEGLDRNASLELVRKLQNSKAGAGGRKRARVC